MLKFPSKKLLLGYFIITSGLYLLIALFFSSQALGIPLLLFLLFISIIILLVYLFKILYNKLSEVERKNLNHYYQTEALLTINTLADIQYPIAKSRGWAASPDFIKIVFNYVLKEQPNTIMELGSGISTLYTGNLIRSKSLASTIVSLDHELVFAEISKANCITHNIDAIASVHHAPIKKHLINDKEWLWYDLDLISLKEQAIGLLVVDGPPTFLQEESRYPAIPLLLKYLKDGAIIIVDDYMRDDDKRVIQRWCTEFKEITLLRERNDTEKGTAILKVERS